MKTYQVVASLDGKWWFVRVLGLGAYPDEGLPTQARRLAEVELMARDLIAVYLDIPADSFDIDVQIELPESVKQHLEQARQHRAEESRLRAQAAAEYRAAARELKSTGLTVRDIGKALEVSHQRAQQLTGAKKS